MHGPVPQASPPQPQVSHSITSDGTPSVARSAATLWQPHSERGVEPVRSGRLAALTGCQGVRPTRERCFLAARAGCGAATNSRHAFWDIFDAFVPYTRATTRLRFRRFQVHLEPTKPEKKTRTPLGVYLECCYGASGSTRACALASAGAQRTCCTTCSRRSPTACTRQGSASTRGS